MALSRMHSATGSKPSALRARGGRGAQEGAGGGREDARPRRGPSRRPSGRLACCPPLASLTGARLRGPGKRRRVGSRHTTRRRLLGSRLRTDARRGVSARGCSARRGGFCRAPLIAPTDRSNQIERDSKEIPGRGRGTGVLCDPPLPYKVDTPRPSLRTNWTCLTSCGVTKHIYLAQGGRSPRRATSELVPRDSAEMRWNEIQRSEQSVEIVCPLIGALLRTKGARARGRKPDTPPGGVCVGGGGDAAAADGARAAAGGAGRGRARACACRAS